MMIALSVAKIYAKTLSIGLCWRCSLKSGLWGINGWRWLTLEQNDTLGTYLPLKHVLRCIERQAAFYGLLCTKELKKTYATWQLYPYAHPELSLSVMENLPIIVAWLVANTYNFSFYRFRSDVPFQRHYSFI